ncbi:MAG: DUF4339 domain-containing protein [Candidatus Wallbacteria bacterium]|nr:DUF4339 domain-containing protein [Candidatus Wallbacteria bacterium]
MKFLEKLLISLGVPIFIMNLLSGLIAGIWLMTLGNWKLIIVGFVLLCTSHFILSFLMLPCMLFLPIGSKLLMKNNPIGYFFGFLYQVYINFLIVGTCALAFNFCISFYHGSSLFGIIPYLLWSWGMALGPWQFFLYKEQDNDFSLITVSCASILYMLFLVSIFLGQKFVSPVILLSIFVQMFILPVVNVFIAIKMQQGIPNNSDNSVESSIYLVSDDKSELKQIKYWFYVDSGQRKGPIVEDELIKLFVSGTLSGSTLVWTDGLLEWQEARTVEILIPAEYSPPPLP